ncbi:casein kinase 2 regulatory subunit [Saccharomycopsis crataegensis]|uniref:Casein kinase II subunit beta n=1 Tax=Saccharomycopsis crataegensis TaxID=43959 RepID=A0AAV5QMQ8_9ASCO|nr:casein kinase 2 regulatory subunit [Saccharomycopsis crataegensis]
MSGGEEFTDESDFSEYWIDWFLGTKGNEYFCDVDYEYITDRFNLTGLNNEVYNIQLAIDLITDNCKLSDIEDERGNDNEDEGEEDDDDEQEKRNQEYRDEMEYSARILYGLIHARYIITTRGLQKMYEKYKNGDFGYCPRVYCQLQPLLPVSMNDQLGHSPVKLYCANCEDLYNPKSTRHSYLDGAFFGTSFPAMFFQTFPQLVPVHNTEVCCPKIYGFELHEYSKLNRWRELQKRKLITKLKANGIPVDNCNGGYASKKKESY